VSRLQASKRIDWILHALAMVKRDAARFPQWHLHIAGSGPHRDALVSLSESLGLTDCVTFHGFVSDEQLASMYESCHVFLMPGRQGYGLPAIEALYQRQGVVVSEESGVVELLSGTPWAAIANRGKDGFALAMQDLLLRVGEPDFFEQSLPQLPTEASWAQQMIAHLGW
jgi:glycosyltransferase involved in cell wall biosynthesis